MKDFYIPKITDEDLEEIREVQKHYKKKIIVKWVKSNVISLLSLFLSFVSLVIAVIAIVVD